MPPRPRLSSTEALMITLGVIIGVLFLSAGVGVAVKLTPETRPGASAHRPPGPAPATTTEPGATSTEPGPSTTRPSATAPPTTRPAGVAPVNPLTAPPVTAPPVNARPFNLPPSVVAGIVNPAVVDVDTRLAYQHAIAAGTGMVLSPNGVVLTNNHVISGATTIGAVSVGTGKAYPAHLIGVDPSADVALIQLEGASGLPTVVTSATAVAPGDPVVAIGNAGGVGGSPSVTSGTVEAVNQSIIATDPAAGTSEQLDGLIQTSATLQPGDSGGPLVNGSGQIIGMDTAASVGRQSARSVSFAIPIGQALAIARQIEAGQASSTIHLGLPPFVGVQVTNGTGPGGRSGAVVTGVVTGGPAAVVGVTAGALITGVNGQSIDSAAALPAVLRQYHPGDVVTLTWLDRGGGNHSAPVTLGTGPAD